MNDLEDTHCEVRRTVDLQLPTPEPAALDEEQSSSHSSPGYNHPPDTLGGFLEDTSYAWLTCRSRLTVFNTRTGASISNWTFKSRITCVAQFPTSPGHIPLLLVGLDNDAVRLRDSVGMICVFDCTISQVLRAIRCPCGVEQLCIITGGADWEEIDDKRLEILPEAVGLACVALRNLDHLIIDLRRASWENFHDSSLHDESHPAELDISDNSSSVRHRNRERHAVHSLMSSRVERYLAFNREEFESTVLPQESLTTALVCAKKIGCLMSGCLGRVILWQTDGVLRWISPPLEESVSVSHMALLEPTDDPRPFIYLWMAHQDDTPASPVLRMFAMLFERKYSFKGANQYFNLEGEPSMKFEMELDEGSRVISLRPVVREINQETETKNTEESLLLISTEGRTFLFDLNQWYKEQMPRTVADCANVDAILSTYHSKTDIPSPDNAVVGCVPVPGSLRDFATLVPGPEEFFFPNSLSLDWIELGTSRIVTWLTRGVQSQLLREMAISGPVVLLHPDETFHRCVSVGLIPFSGDSSFNSDPDSQRECLLTLCLEQRWTTFLLRCAREWSDGSAAYFFPAFIRWAVQRASTIKLTAHRVCIPLFDQSGSGIGEAEVKTLRSFSQQMECLSNVFENLAGSGFTSDQEQQQRTLRRITIYLQVLLWFYDVGLLPETQEVDEESLPISIVMRIPYPAERLLSIYREKREKYEKEGLKKGDKEEDLFIDELITRDCGELISQWEREATETASDGRYPPPSLQSLLRSLLTDCYQDDGSELESKHQIIIYLLMDLVMMLQGSCPSVDQLVKYPGAFKLSPSLIKLTQALWLLDHEDYQGFLEIMTGQLVCDSDVKDWHHKLVIRTLIRSAQNKLALIYLRVRKPPLSSLEDQGTIITLSVEHGLVQSAFHRRPPSHYSQLLRKFFRACKENGRLNDILHLAMDYEEEETFVQFLEEEKCDETKLLYYLQRSRYNEASGIQLLGQKLCPPQKSSSFAVFKAYNATLPEVTRKFTTNLAKRNVQVDPDGNYPRPLSHMKSRARIREMHESVIKKARETFTRGDRLQIPFITAPLLSLKSNINNSEANCVLFADRCTAGSYGKRTLDEMRDPGTPGGEGPRKRMRTDEDMAKIEDNRQLSLSMVFDTPLVQRKNQLMSAKSVETPQSILKIRRMIQESVSPVQSAQVSPTEEEREKRPRQIRFSLIQPRLDGSTDETEPERNEVGNTADPSESAGSESFRSPENSAEEERLGQTTILSGNSSISPSASGPRCRPSLRKSAFNESNDLLKRSLRLSTTRNLSLDSSKLSLDNSVTDIISSTMITPGTPGGSRPLDPSMCATTILSSGSSFDMSQLPEPTTKKNESDLQPSLDSTISCTTSFEDFESDEASEENSANNSLHVIEEIVTRTSITTVEEFENNQMTDVNDNTEHDSHFEGDEKSYHSMEVVEMLEVRTEESINEIAEKVIDEEVEEKIVESAEEKIEETVEKNEEIGEEKVEEQMPENRLDERLDEQIDRVESTDVSFSSHEPALSEFVEVPTETLEPPEIADPIETPGLLTTLDVHHVQCDDYDEELVALKYEDDEEDEVFESLSESTNLQSESHRETATPGPCESPRKSATSRFYEEFNITDDESRSVDESLFASRKQMTNLTIPKTIPSDSINITDDESEPEDNLTPLPTTRSNLLEKSEVKVVAKSPKKAVKASPKAVVMSPKGVDTDSPKGATQMPPKRQLEESPKRPTEGSPKSALPESPKGTITESPKRVLAESSSKAVTVSPKKILTDSPEKKPTPSPKRRAQESPRSVEGSPKKAIEESPQRTVQTPRRPEKDLEVGNEEESGERLPRSRRGSSLLPEGFSSTPDPRKASRNRRASSLAPLSSTAISPMSSPLKDKAESPIVPVKRRGRPPGSLVKEVLTSSLAEKLDEVSNVSESVELPMRRSARRKEPETAKASTPTPEPIQEDPDESLNIIDPSRKSTRGRRASLVAKDVNVPRKTRAASVSKEQEPVNEMDKPPRSTRAGSLADVPERCDSLITDDQELTNKKIRGVSIVEDQELANEESGEPIESIGKLGQVSSSTMPATEEVKAKGKRGRPISKHPEVNEGTEKLVKKTRSGSAADASEDVSRITKEQESEAVISATQEGKPKAKRGRPTSKSAEVSEETEKLGKKTRSGSAVDVLEEDIVRNTKEQELTNRKPRGGSIVKDQESVNQESGETTEKLRRAGSSVIRDTEEVKPKGKRGRPASKSMEVNEETEKLGKKSRSGSAVDVAEEDVPRITKNEELRNRKTRAASVVKEHESVTNESGSNAESTRKSKKASTLVSADTEEVKTRGKRGRASPTSLDVNEEPEKLGRKTRAGSVADISEDMPKRLTRAASVSKELEESKGKKPKRSTAASVPDAGVDQKSMSQISDGEGDINSIRRTRGSSVAKETTESTNEEEAPKRGRRAASVTKETEQVAPKRRRAGSVAKDDEEDSKDTSVATRRMTRASSMSKDDESLQEASLQEKVPARSTRRRGSVPKELPSESLRTRRGGSIVRDVIPEENSEDSVVETRLTRNSSRVPGEGSDSIRGRGIQAIPEDEELSLVVRARQRRAMSVDMTEVEGGRTRRNGNESREVEKVENKGKKVAASRTRAASETKDLDDGEIIERPRRGRKPSQKEEFKFAAPEEARGEVDGRYEDQVPDFVFSPPVLRTKESVFQDRREIVDFIPPLSDEEKKLISGKSRRPSQASNTKQINRPLRVPGYRTKFVLSKRSQSTSK